MRIYRSKTMQKHMKRRDIENATQWKTEIKQLYMYVGINALNLHIPLIWNIRTEMAQLITR